MKLLVATANAGKLREFAQALGRLDVEVVGLEALADVTAVEETGATFLENATLKAEAFSRRTDLPVLADDSGLEVDALEGRPGVLSARFGGPQLSDAARSKAVLKGLVDVPDAQRTARFQCVLAVARGGRTLATFEGRVEGRILRELRGKNGFGYDPIFLHPESGKTFAEMVPEEKEAVSHRGRALASLGEALAQGLLS
ncbi:MAG TPA: XTP/dITP diphosphatase [Candidatus Polarisedimenticolaceae bacterium]|nr:XTP/dITP diphosphatase [Candidatus Polarisedimenticolaceae bacterium]